MDVFNTGFSRWIKELSDSGAASAGKTLSVGSEYIAAITWLGSTGDFDSNIGAVTDITDPAGTGGWTDIIDVTPSNGGSGILWLMSSTINLWIDLTEAAGTAARLQILDGTGKIVLDVTCEQNAGADSIANITMAAQEESLFFNAGLKIRVARKGSVTTASSKFVYPGSTLFEIG